MSETLRELATVHYGKSPNAVKTDEEWFPIYGTGGQMGFANAPLFNGPLVVVARKGTLGNPTYSENACWVIDTAYAVVATAKTDTKWLYYNFRNFDLESLNEATGVPSISRDYLYRIRFVAPPLTQQRKIARILTTVDNLIEKTESLIAKYESIKQGMMHDLFTRGVDAHGQLRPPYAQAPELYKHSELGWIPKEWDCGTLGSISQWMSGGTPSKSNQAFWSGTVPWFSPKDMKSFELIDSEDHISEDASRCGTRLIPPGTIFIVIRGMILAHSFPVGITTRPATFNQDIKALLCDGPVGERFLAHWLKNRAQEMVNLATESTHGTKRFDMDDLYNVAIGIPALHEQATIVKLLDTIDSNRKGEQLRLEKLKQSKTGLMQDLLTGKVRVTTDELDEVAG